MAKVKNWMMDQEEKDSWEYERAVMIHLWYGSNASVEDIAQEIEYPVEIVRGVIASEFRRLDS
jgi:predicted transcriptional regulator